MATVSDLIAKRDAVPVAELAGIFVRDMTYGETRRMTALAEQSDRSCFVIGKSLVDAAGCLFWPQVSTESDAEYVARLAVDLDSLPSQAVRSISEAISEQMSKPINTERLKKKSPETGRLDSAET